MQTNIGCNKEFAGIKPPGMIQIDKTLTKPGFAADAAAAGVVVRQAMDAISHYPIVGNNGDWYVFDPNAGQYIDTGQATTITTIVVNQLPIAGKKGTIYLVPNKTEENRYDEYIWVEDSAYPDGGCNHNCPCCPRPCPRPTPTPTGGRFELLGPNLDLSAYATVEFVENNFLRKEDQVINKVEPDVTTYQEISDLANDNKTAVFNTDNRTYFLSGLDEDKATFTTTYMEEDEQGNPVTYMQVVNVDSNNNWTASEPIQLINDKDLEKVEDEIADVKQQVEDVVQDVEKVQEDLGVVEENLDNLGTRVQSLEDYKDEQQPLVQAVQNLFDEHYNLDIDIIDGNGW